METPSPGTILVVEDAATIRESVAIYFRNEGYVVLEAADGATALALLTTERPDLMLLDLGLPDISGVDVLRASRDRNRRLRTIVITALSDVPLARSCMIFGAVDYIEKPIDFGYLARRVRQVLTEALSG